MGVTVSQAGWPRPSFSTCEVFLDVMAQYKGAASEGNRAANLLKQRERAKEELERMKMKIAEV